MPRTYMITNRKRHRGGYGNDPQGRGRLNFLIADNPNEIAPDRFQSVDKDEFLASLVAELAENHLVDHRKQLGLYIHGYNNNFEDALVGLAEINRNLNEHTGYRGLVIGFSWPSEGRVDLYIEDRDDARESVTAMVHLLHLIKAIRLPADQCDTDVSLIAHSMGAYVVREGFRYFWKHIGYPASEIYFNQTLLLAADISNRSMSLNKMGQAISALSHRVTIYHSHHDGVLGLSKRFKHFGTRRIGRSGPRSYGDLPGNVVALDCSEVANETNAGRYNSNVHSSYRRIPQILQDMVATMEGIDRAAIPSREPIDATGRSGYILIRLQ